MATRRLTSVRRPLKLAIDRRVACRWKGRNVFNASVPIAIEAVSRRSFFNTWFRIKAAIGRRRGRK